MIKRAGENISASEVEGVLLDYPGVAEAAVIGVATILCATRPSRRSSFSRKAHAKTKRPCVRTAPALADFKVPTLFEFPSELPHTSVGKVAKKLLS